MSPRHVASSIALLVGLTLTAHGLAQHAPESPLVDELVRINERAAAEAAAGHHDEAARLFQASLLLEELDISYLNLGRSLALAGRCDEALVAYEQALVAPPCGDPSPAEIAATVERYRAELVHSCAAELTVACAGSGTELAIDGAAPLPCTRDPLRLAPGSHRIEASASWGARLSVDVALIGMEKRTLELSFPPPPPPERVIDEQLVLVEEPADISSPLLWGGVGAGLGVAALGSALLVEYLLIDPVYDDYRAAAARGDRATYASLRDTLEELQPTNRTLFIAGAVLSAAGVTVVVLDLVGVFDSPTERANVALELGPLGGALSWRW